MSVLILNFQVGESLVLDAVIHMHVMIYCIGSQPIGYLPEGSATYTWCIYSKPDVSKLECAGQKRR